MTEPIIITPAEAAAELLVRRKAKASLYEFLKAAWPIMEPGYEYRDGWYVEAICEHLEAVFNGEIKRLLINMPPRYLKTGIAGVAFTAWAWLQRPTEKFIYGSYSYKVAEDASIKCRQLIENQWFQKRWGALSSKSLITLSEDRNTKEYFANDKGGERIITSVDGTLTGRGADILVADDPNNVKDTSDAVLATTLHWWTQVVPTRLNDPKKGRKIVIQQRMSEKDISGHILANEPEDWVKLILPLEFEPKRRCVTVALPSTKGKPWCDPRKVEGEPLCPARAGPEEIKRLKKELASEYAIAGQLQQRPSPGEGGVLKRKWFKPWKYEPPKCRFKIMSIDTSLSDTETSAYNAATTWGVFDDDHQVPNIILLSSWRKRCEYHELREVVTRMARHYLDDGPLPNPRLEKPNKPDIILIEDKGFGRLMIRDLQRAGVTAHGFNPQLYGSKDMRVRIAQPMLEGGRVWFPALKTSTEEDPRFKPFADVFVEQACAYPKAESRDLVDTMSQAIIRLQVSGFVWVAGDPGPDEPADHSQRAEFY